MPDAEHVEQHAVHGGLRGEHVLQEVLDRFDEGRREVRGAEQGHAGLVGGRGHLGRDLEALGHHQAGHVLAKNWPQHGSRPASWGRVAR